jgi:hypothetical protein
MKHLLQQHLEFIMKLFAQQVKDLQVYLWFLYSQNAVGITYEIGDATPRDRIKLVGIVTAKEMMKILQKK